MTFRIKSWLGRPARAKCDAKIAKNAKIAKENNE